MELNELPSENHNQQTEFGMSRIDLNPVQAISYQIRQAIGNIIVGQHEMVELLLVALLADGHVLIEGVPGVAKTLTAKTLARLIDTHFSRIQFTPDLMPGDVIGTNIFNPKEAAFDFKSGPIFSNIVLIDEINRAPAKTQAALFEVMEERQVTVDGTTYKLPPPFMVLATQNPIEHEGTYRLPEAQLDRFIFKINVGYPSVEEEIKILQAEHEQKGKYLVDQIRPVISPEALQHNKALVQQVHAEPKLLDFIAKISNATRSDKSLYLGASPRASLAMLNASKALAVLHSRDFITPEDILHIAPSVLRHRIALTPEREMEGATPDVVLKEIIAKMEVPR